MATQHHNLSDQHLNNPLEPGQLRIAIVRATWNEQVTLPLQQGAIQFLVHSGVRPSDILLHTVPGSFELSLGAQYVAQQSDVDAVIALGCVIQGETRHFEFICHAVAQGITQVGLKYNKPVVFGVLTTDTLQQALDRAGGQHGNKGVEAAATALNMLGFFRQQLRASSL